MMQGKTVILILGAVAASVLGFGERLRAMLGVGTVLIVIGVACLFAGD